MILVNILHLPLWILMSMTCLTLFIVGIAPLVGAALITGASGLLSSLFSKDKEKEQYKYQSKLAEEERRWREQMQNKAVTSLKPQKEYYESGAVPYLSNLMQKLALGNVGSRLSPDMLKKWGIDLGDISKTVGLDQPYSQTPDAQRYYGAPKTPAIGTMGSEEESGGRAGVPGMYVGMPGMNMGGVSNILINELMKRYGLMR